MIKQWSDRLADSLDKIASSDDKKLERNQLEAVARELRVLADSLEKLATGSVVHGADILVVVNELEERAKFLRILLKTTHIS